MNVETVRHEDEIGIRLPQGPAAGNAWDHVAATFLDVALGGRGAWIATLADPSNLDWAAVLDGNTEGSGHVVRTCNGRHPEVGPLVILLRIEIAVMS